MAFVVAILLAYSGAFGTGDLPVAVRYGYWIGLTATGAVLSHFVVPAVLFLPFLQGRPWMTGAAVSLVVALMMTLIVTVTGVLVLHQRPHWMLPVFLFPAVAVVTLTITALVYLIRGADPLHTHAAPKGSPPARFLERIPAKLQGGELLAVEAEDHYLRIHTSRGQDLILMRLSDAVAELEGLEGAQTHRSWWVAKDAVVEAERGDGRATLTLKNGVEAPVSRAYAKVLRSEGWF